MKQLLKKKGKYIAIGIGFIIIVYLISLFAFPKSYALDGFGQVNLKCDKTIALGGTNITCSVTGTVAPTSQVSSLSSQISLSDNLEFVSFTSDSIWEGIGDDGNIQLYTAVNKTETFNIGTFVVKVKDGIINTTETISIEDNYFYDEKFEEQVIDSVSLDMKTPQFSSEVYEITDKYILSDTKDIATIIKNINTEECSVSVNNNGSSVTTGTIVENSKLKIMNGSKLLKELPIIYIGSNKYDLTKKYIVTSESDLINIKDDIEVLNGSLSIKNGELVLSYNNTGIKYYDIVNVYSNLYRINLDKNYIFITSNNTDSLLDNISKSDNASLSIDGNKLNISYNEEIVSTLNILSISSSKYDIDVNSGYINIKNNKISNNIINDITSDVVLSISGNKLIGKYNENVIMELDIISINSDKYKIDSNFNYIYTNTIKDLDDIKNNLELVNGDISINDNKLQLKYKDKVISELNHYYFSTTYKIDNGNMYTKEVLEYAKFLENITFNGLTYKIYNSSNQEVTTGNIEDKYSIKIYKDSDVLDTYTIKLEYLEIKNLTINEDKKIIYKLPLSSTYNDILKNIDTSGNIEVLDENNEKIELTSKIRSSDIISIQLSSETIKYKVSVSGDVAGSGEVSIGDVAKLYQGLKGKIELDDISKLAGDVTNDGEIKIGDVAKLYQYLKGKISTLD